MNFSQRKKKTLCSKYGEVWSISDGVQVIIFWRDQGPAGAGKSTYCDTMEKHMQHCKRSVHIVNLDPAAEHFAYTPSIGTFSYVLFVFVSLLFVIEVL